MYKYPTIIAFLFFAAFSSFAQQNIKDYQGNWEGILPNSNCLNFNISIEELDDNNFNLIISNYKTALKKKLTSNSTDRIQLRLDERTLFNLSYNTDKTEITGFITSGIMMYHIRLVKTTGDFFTGVWQPFMIDSLASKSVFLSVENSDDGGFATYPLFGDQRFTGTWAGEFTKNADVIFFRDYKTGLKFKATLLENKIQFEILLLERTMAVTNLTRSEIDLSSIHSDNPQNQTINKPKAQNDGWPIASIKESNIKAFLLNRMIDSINSKALENTHSVLIAKEGKLVFEAYFEGYNVNVPHDQRSASKSIASAMIGIAIDDNIMESVNQSVYDFLPEAYQYTKDSLKALIKIKDLLTMSSGLDAIDFGIDRNSIASEDNYQNTDDWLKTVLEAPMLYGSGIHANYASANPFLLSASLSEQLEQPLELYMDQKLFAPLGISNYIIQTENTGTIPYFGGGMYLTPRDMLKFGELYLNNGVWKGQQIISKRWVEASFKKYLKLENTYDKDEYGYLWWHNTYTINNEDFESYEARGAGGQNIFVIPKLKTVVVITSGNYRNGKYQQPIKILEEYILPAMVE